VELADGSDVESTVHAQSWASAAISSERRECKSVLRMLGGDRA